MENTAPIQASATPTSESTSQNDNWIWIAIGVVALYLVFTKKKKVKKEEEEDGITSYESFSQTNLGRSLSSQLKKSYIELNEAQVKDLDQCFGGLTKAEKKVLKKACMYASKEGIARNLDKSEIAIFKPLRQRIINCFREQKINIE